MEQYNGKEQKYDNFIFDKHVEISDGVNFVEKQIVNISEPGIKSIIYDENFQSALKHFGWMYCPIFKDFLQLMRLRVIQE